MISVNATLFVQVIHFLLMVYIMNRLMLRPIMRQVDEREKHIVQAKQNAADMVVEADHLAEKRVSMEKEARSRAGEERAAIRQEAAERAEQIFAQTRDEVAEIRARMDRDIEAQVSEATAVLNREVAAIAGDIVYKIAGRRVNH
jgi:F-type H+-transporting ATPase subunit b